MPARQLEIKISGAVVVEGVRIVVGGATVRLHHQLGSRPGEVDAVPYFVAVHYWGR